jgi:hypothetical protein
MCKGWWMESKGWMGGNGGGGGWTCCTGEQSSVQQRVVALALKQARRAHVWRTIEQSGHIIAGEGELL